MKIKLFFSSVALVIASLSFSSCANAEGSKDGEGEDKHEMNSPDNNANTPNTAPGTEYPGSSQPGDHAITDTLKQH